MSRPQTPTLLFSEPAKAIAAIKVLAGAGVSLSKISIQTWGDRVALRPREVVTRVSLDEIIALGGELISAPAMGLPTPATPASDRSRLLEAVV